MELFGLTHQAAVGEVLEEAAISAEVEPIIVMRAL